MLGHLLAKVAVSVARKAFCYRDCGYARNVSGWGMVASSSEFQTKILRRSADPDEYKLYRAALEWDLTDRLSSKVART